jgi:outer membrane protein TolC
MLKMNNAYIRIILHGIIINFIIAILCLSSINQLSAQNNLDYYLQAAYKNNPNIKEANNLIRVNELNKNIIEAQYSTPHISVSANYLLAPYFNNNGQYITSNPGPNAVGYDISLANGGLYAAQVNFEKNIFNSGLIDTYYAQSDIQINTQQINIELLRHSLKRDITDQYLKCSQSQQMYLLTKAIADTLQEQLKITENLVMTGSAKQSDYLLLKIEVENQSISSSQYMNDLKSNMIALNTLCGLSDSALVRFSGTILEYNVQISYSNFLKQFKIDSMNAENLQAIFETKYLPTFNIFFNTGLNAVELNGIQRKFGLSAGINFNYPLYDGSQRSLTQQQSQISLMTIKNYKENQIIVLVNKIKDAKAQIEFNAQNVKKIKQQIKNYEQVIELTRSELNRGQMTIIEYITIIRNYLELLKNEVTANTAEQLAINQYNYWNW